MYKVKFDTGEEVDFENEPTDADIEEVVQSLGIKPKSATIPDDSTPPTPPQKSLVDKVGSAAKKISNFVGAGGIVDQFSSSLARATIPKDQRQYVGNPSLKRVVGSAIQSGANLIPGVGGVGTKLATRVAAGAGTGYAFDVGSKLQANNSMARSLVPGIGAVTAGALPLLGKITGLVNPAQNLNKVSRKLEEINLRLTPVDKQNLAKQGKDIAEYLSKMRVIGTPEQRFSKVDKIYEQMEGKVQEIIKKSGINIPRQQVIDEVSAITGQYVDNLSEFDSVVGKIERIVKTLKSNYGDNIPAEVINNMKRNEFKNAYAKNATDVVNEVSHNVGSILKNKLDQSIPNLKGLNKEYGLLITSRRVLGKAQTRAQVGVVGKAISSVAAGIMGGAVGGPAGGAVGAMVGPAVGKVVAGTATRSAIGAGARKFSNLINKIPVNKTGNLQIGRKALLNLLESAR